MGGCVDVGAIMKIGSNPDTYGGVAIQNLGFQEAYIKIPDIMPINIKAGISTEFDVTQYAKVTLALDVNRLWVKDELPTLDAGIEAIIYELVCVRAGFGLRHDVSNFALGVGLLLEKVRFSYAYQPFEELGNAHRITIDIQLYEEE
jgi:hypothetical protein